MKRISILYITLLCLLIANVTMSQSLPDPITNSTADFGMVNSDYGPRNMVGESQRFHYGIDYDLDRGEKAYAVEQGAIERFGSWTKDYAFIKAGNWRYMHVETQNTDNFTWEYVENVFSEQLGEDVLFDNFIFLREYLGNDNWTLINVIGTIEYQDPCIDIYDDKSESWTELKQSVELGESFWIFTPRDYGAPLEDDDHLHLDYQANLSTTNPFKYVAHQDDGPPGLPHIAVKKEENGLATNFESNLVYGKKVILEGKAVSLGDKDIDHLSVSCQFLFNNNICFKKHYQYSKNDGEEQNCTDKVKYIYGNNEDLFFQAVEEGIYPFFIFPSIDFFKFHWNTIENESSDFVQAEVNESAVYPDGNYNIQFKVKDIMGAESPPESTQVILDNFQPYVKRLEIINGGKIYSSSIQFTQPNPPWEYFLLVRKVDQSNQYKFGVYDYDIEIIVEMSEAMHNVHLEIENTSYSNELSQVSDDARTWNCIMPLDDLHNLFPPQQALTEYPLHISGVDKTEEHEVLDLDIEEDGENRNVQELPYRDGSGVWVYETPLGHTDKDHKLVFCGECDFLRAVFDAQMQDGNNNDVLRDGFTDLYGHSPLTISFVDLSSGEPDSWIWDFGDMQGPTNEQNPVHTFYNSSDDPVQFDICLKVNKADDSDLTIKNKMITVYPAGYNITPIPDFDSEQITNSPPYRIDFYNYSSGPIQEFRWDFGDENTNNSDFEPLHFYEDPGTYDITLTLNPGYTDEEDITKTIQIAESSGINSEVDFGWYCYEANNQWDGEGILGSLIYFESIVSNNQAVFFDWDMGDGVDYINIDSYYHTYTSSGIFFVTLKVYDFHYKFIGQKTKTIQIIQNTQVIQPAGNEIPFGNLISDIELLDDEDVLFVAEDDKIHVFHFDIDNTPHPWYPSQLIELGNYITNIVASGDNLLVGCAYEDNLRGRVHCFSKVNGLWQEQQLIMDPDYNQGWFWRFGHFMAIDQNHVIISAYNEEGKKHKITLWEYDPISELWQYVYFFYTPSDHPTPPKIEINSNVVIINSDVYTYQGDNWVMANYILPYNDSYIGMGVNTITMDGNIMMATEQCIENSYAHLYKIENNQPAFMNTLFSPGNNSYAYSVSKRNNYIIAGNRGINYDCDFVKTKTNGSAILFRSNAYDYYYRYRTFSPENGIEGDLFGAKVEMNKYHIIVYSQGRKDGYYDKYPSFYYYYDNEYLCDKTLYINSKKDLNNNKRSDFPLNARIIEVAGNRALSIKSSENVKMVGQKITLKPGFSVVEGGTLMASGTHCLDCYIQDNNSKQYFFKSTDIQDTIISVAINNNRDEFNIFPNPANDFVNVKAIYPGSIIKNIRILNMQGVICYNKSFKNNCKDHIIDIANFYPGQYIVKVEGLKSISNLKLVKL